MQAPVNFKILSHPINWIVVLLMLIIAGAAGHMLLQLIGLKPTTASSYDSVPAGQSKAASN